MGREAFCQQWTLTKGTFLVNVATPMGLNHRVVLAWMAVETGGDPDPTAKFNFLQIKGTGRGGVTADGFAIYKSVKEAAKAARERIRREPAIMAARGEGSDALMKAIAKSWDDGPDVSRGPVPMGYLGALKGKYACINPKDVLGGGFLGVSGDDPDRTLGVPKAIAAPRAWLKQDVLPDLEEKLPEWADAMWPVLLQFAVATTGLALIGYGVVRLFGGAAKTATEKVVPIAGAVSARRVG